LSLNIGLPVLNFITDPFIKLMGIIINYIYKLMLVFGIEKIAICIVLFTVAIKLLTLPLTYKQQKFSKVSAKMNPEIQAISEKYKGRRDQDSMMKMQMEQQAVYRKYGSSPMSGCLPLIILMIILFALYPVVYSIPTYVKDVQAHYLKIIDPILSKDNGIPENIAVDEEGNILKVKYNDDGSRSYTDAEGNEAELKSSYTLSDAIYAFYNDKGVYVRKAPKYKQGKTEYSESNLVAIMAGFSEDSWNDFFDGTKIDKDKAEAWNLYAPYLSDLLNKEYKDGDSTVNPVKVKNKIIDINTILGVNIFDKPGFKSVTILIPILAALLQFLQTQLSMALNKNDDSKKKKKNTEPSPMDSMKTMNYIMPFFSGIICFTLPIGVGIYWIVSSVVSIILQVIINAKLKDMDVSVFVEESEEKNKKQLEKYGVHNDNQGQMANVARTSTKSIASYASSNTGSKGGKKDKFSKQKDIKIPEEKRHLKAGSIAAIANIYRNDEEDAADAVEEVKDENNGEE